jgi:PrtD family type I secretion system ABC transporter
VILWQNSGQLQASEFVAHGQQISAVSGFFPHVCNRTGDVWQIHLSKRRIRDIRSSESRFSGAIKGNRGKLMSANKGIAELRGAMGRCRWHFTSVAVFSIFVNLLMLTGPLFMLQIYDRVLSSRSEATLVALLILVTGLFAMMGLLEFIRGRVLARAGARFQSLLDSRVMIAVLRRSIAPNERARPNTAARDLDAVRQLLSGPAPFAMFDMPWAPIFIAVIFLFHPFLGWLAIAGTVILVCLTFLNQIRSREPSAESQQATNEAENLGEALRQNAEAVQGLGMRREGLSRWGKMRQEALSLQIVASDRTASYAAASKSLRFYLQSVMLAAGAYLVLQQEISAGMMIAGSIMLGRALAPVEQAIGQWSLAQRAARGWASLSELLEKTPEEIEKTALPAPKGFVDVQGITVAAPGTNVPVLRAINFKVEPGMALGVIGPSGAGKTTLGKVLTGIWRPAAGKVRIDGAALDQWPEDEIGRHIGYLPQEIGLMSGTVAENISRMAETRNDADVVTAAKLAGAHELLLTLPQGYDTQIGAGGQRLSGGQRQRVALARALYGDPPLLVLDEPNANLDAPGEQALVDSIRQAKKRGKTVIIMAHRPSAIAACDLLLMVDKGMQVDFGPRDEVLKKHTRNYPQLVGNTPPAAGPAGVPAPLQPTAAKATTVQPTAAKPTAANPAHTPAAPPPSTVTGDKT